MRITVVHFGNAPGGSPSEPALSVCVPWSGLDHHMAEIKVSRLSTCISWSSSAYMCTNAVYTPIHFILYPRVMYPVCRGSACPYRTSIQGLQSLARWTGTGRHLTLWANTRRRHNQCHALYLIVEAACLATQHGLHLMPGLIPPRPTNTNTWMNPHLIVITRWTLSPYVVFNVGPTS